MSGATVLAAAVLCVPLVPRSVQDATTPLSEPLTCSRHCGLQACLLVILPHLTMLLLLECWVRHIMCLYHVSNLLISCAP